jgi:hypothetical protein
MIDEQPYPYRIALRRNDIVMSYRPAGVEQKTLPVSREFRWGEDFLYWVIGRNN